MIIIGIFLFWFLCYDCWWFVIIFVVFLCMFIDLLNMEYEICFYCYERFFWFGNFVWCCVFWFFFLEDYVYIMFFKYYVVLWFNFVNVLLFCFCLIIYMFGIGIYVCWDVICVDEYWVLIIGNGFVLMMYLLKYVLVWWSCMNIIIVKVK